MSNNGEDQSSELSSEEPREPLWQRVKAGCAGSVAAVGGAAATAFSATQDGLESLKYGAQKSSVKLDKWAADGMVGRMFRFKERNAKLSTEMRAGLITFLMVSYILAVNPQVLATTGGTCIPEEVCQPADYATLGPQCLANSDDPGAMDCMASLTRSLITATSASSLISTFFIGYFGNLPLALAPGIGINAYVAYQVVGQFGQGDLTYSQAMTAIFVEGWFFVLLSITGVRGGIVKYMPKSIAMASSVGIGMLLAFTGLRNMGMITFDSATLLTLGGCPADHRNYLYAFDTRLGAEQLANLTLSTLPIPATVYGCMNQTMRSPTMWLGIAGGFLMAILLYMGVKGSLIIGIIFVTVVSWIPGHSATYLGSSSPIPGGVQRMDVFKQVVAAPTLSATGLAWDWSAFKSGQLWLALFTFLYIDLLDCTGTLLSMARLLEFSMPGFLSDDMEFPGQMWAFLSDGIGIITGSMMGTTSLTVYIESAAGIEDGGRTGVTAIVVSFFYFVSLFFSPILASIPPYATGPALVLVGTILLGHIAHIEWDDIGVAIPAFLTMVLMPFTYSVAYGVIAGLASYVAIHLPFWLMDAARRRWWPQKDSDDVAPSPRQARLRRRSKAGYNVRKTFGPPEDTPSRADSYVGGYDESYHNTYQTHDSGRRPALPLTMSAGGGGAAAGSSHHGMANIFFPDAAPGGGMMRTSGAGRTPSELEALPPGLPHPGNVSIFRKSYSMHSPGRMPDNYGSYGAAQVHGYGSNPRSLPILGARGPRPGTAGAADPSASHHSSYAGGLAYLGGPPSIPNSSPARSGIGVPHAAAAAAAAGHFYRPTGLQRQQSVGPQARGQLSNGGSTHDSTPTGAAGGMSRGMSRSRTFSYGMSDMQAGTDLHLRTTSNSAHGGEMFKLFPDAPFLGSGDSELQGSHSFRLFGDVGPLALEGEEPSRQLRRSSMAQAAAEAVAEVEGQQAASAPSLQAESSFRLFGDVEPMELSNSLDTGQAAALQQGLQQQQQRGGQQQQQAGTQRQQQQGEPQIAKAWQQREARQAQGFSSFHVEGTLEEGSRRSTADLSFGGRWPGARPPQQPQQQQQQPNLSRISGNLGLPPTIRRVSSSSAGSGRTRPVSFHVQQQQQQQREGAGWERSRRGSRSYSDLQEAQGRTEADGEGESPPVHALALAAAAARSPSQPYLLHSSSGGELPVLETLHETASAEATAAAAASAAAREDAEGGHQLRERRSSSNVRADLDVFDRMLRTLGGSRRNLALSSDAETESGGGGGGGSGGGSAGGSAASSFAADHGRSFARSTSLRSSSLAMAAQQLEVMRRGGDSSARSDGSGGSARVSRGASLGATSGLLAGSPPTAEAAAEAAVLEQYQQAQQAQQQQAHQQQLGAEIEPADRSRSSGGVPLLPSPFGGQPPAAGPFLHEGSLELDFHRKESARQGGSSAARGVPAGPSTVLSSSLSGIVSCL